MIESKMYEGWNEKPTPIDTTFLFGEGYQVELLPEVKEVTPYQRDIWATKWLKEHGRLIRHTVYSHIRHHYMQDSLIITSLEYKPATSRGRKISL